MTEDKENKKLHIFFLLVILGIAFLFRFWKLNSIPPGLYPDEAMNSNNALDSLQSRDFKVFYPDNNGREGLFMWLIALSFKLFGPGILAQRAVSAIIGTLTILGLYFLTKELFSHKTKKHYSALFASFFLAISFWHINFSRISFRAIQVPFILTFGFYFLSKGLRKNKLRDIVLAGIIFGLGFYTYISYRFVIFILAAALIIWGIIYKKNRLQKRFFLHLILLLSFIFLTALPIGIYFFQHPEDFVGRAGGVSIFSQEKPIAKAVESLILHLAMFNFAGDRNWRHNFSGSPELFWPIGIFFLIGVIIATREAAGAKKNKDYPVLSAHILIIAWFLAMLLPGILSYEGIPHALRVIGVIPVVYLLSGLGAWRLFEELRKSFKTKKQIYFLHLSVFVFSLALGYAEFDRYFYKWAGDKNTQWAFSKNFVEIGRYLISLPEDFKKYVIVNQEGTPVPLPDGIPMPAQTTIFLERSAASSNLAIYILPKNIDDIRIERKTVIVPLQEDEGLLKELSARFPGGQMIKKEWFTVYQF